jgi:hypothetical protein
VSGDIMEATRRLFSFVADSQRRKIAVEASAFLPVSVDLALSLYRAGMDAAQLRAALEAHLRGAR